MKNHSEVEKEFVITISATAAAVRAYRAIQMAQREFKFPELPKRPRWQMVPDLRQLQADLLTILQVEAPSRDVLAAVRRMRKNLQLVQDAQVMRNFRTDPGRAQELIDEKLDMNGGSRMIELPDHTARST